MRMHRRVSLLAVSLTSAFLVACDVAPPELPPLDFTARDQRGQSVECGGADGASQYHAEVLPGGIDHLKVTFDSLPESAEAERVLRRCLDVARASMEVEFGMVVTAWLGKDGPLPLSDGSSHLSYDPKTSEVRTSK